jgi:circadian clock protein KaiC
MNDQPKVRIAQLPTGVPGLDLVLGGGLPELSFNLVAGAPGTGKTTLAHQFMFANASPASPALYFTVLGEPALKMLRYQQQFRFFDPDKLNGSIRFVNLSREVLETDLGAVLESIVREVQQSSPSIVVVDSFRTVARATASIPTGDVALQGFVQRLALYLTSWEATTFLVGEYMESEMEDNPVFTVADGLLWLFQSVERNSIVRRMQVMKLRGQAAMPGLHTFRITGDGLQVFPRSFGLMQKTPRPRPPGRISTGVAGLDEMLGGGLTAGDSVMVAGPAGSGKSALCTQFIAEGIRRGEPGIIAVFEEHPAEYVARAEAFGLDMTEMIRQGKLKVLYLRPLDLSVDETLRELHDGVEELGAQRVVIDSLSGFELALAPAFREDFRESLYRMVGSLTGIGVTVLTSVEVTESFQELRFSPHAVSFLTDDIILQRYVEMDGRLCKVMMVVKMRRGEHSKEMRLYDITSEGLVIGRTLWEYEGIITGVPRRRETARRPVFPGLTDPETAVLQALVELREAPADELARRTGLQPASMKRALRRLVALRYALRVVEEGRTVYRPMAQPTAYGRASEDRGE